MVAITGVLRLTWVQNHFGGKESDTEISVLDLASHKSKTFCAEDLHFSLQDHTQVLYVITQ